MTVHSLDDLADLQKKMKLMFSIQKNWHNGQSITFVMDDKHMHICPVCLLYQLTCVPKVLVDWIISQWVSLSTIKALCDISLPTKLQMYFNPWQRHVIPFFPLHSVRVWAVVLLDESGINSDFIKSCLRWMGNLYRLYLQDTGALQTKHISALEHALNDFMMLFGRNCTALPITFQEMTQWVHINIDIRLCLIGQFLFYLYCVVSTLSQTYA